MADRNPGGKAAAESAFATSVVLDSIGVSPRSGDWRLEPRVGLVGPRGVCMGEPELARVFDRVTLRDQFRSGRRDVLGRLVEPGQGADFGRPWVDELSRECLQVGTIQNETPGIGRGEGRFRVMLSHDVDRTTGREPTGLLRAFLGELGIRREGALPLRAAVSSKGLVDNAERLFAYEAEHGIRSHVFMLAGPFGLGRYASRTSPEWTSWRDVLRNAKATGMRIGLHASYEAREGETYGEERRRIEDAAEVRVTCQRNHYLRYDPVRHWGQLECAGIEYDFSLGFVNRTGFRSGTAQCHRTFNFDEGRESTVRAVPMVFMDTCLGGSDERCLLSGLRQTLLAARASAGCVCLNFHPETFLIRGGAWDFFREVVRMCGELGADLSGELPPARRGKVSESSSNQRELTGRVGMA